MSDFASIESVIADAREAWRPPPRLTLSEWADAHFRLSVESAAQPGQWHTLPYQREIMDAITDPAVSEVSLIKSARIGFTLMVSAAVGYYIDQAPCPILMAQPTVDDAKNYSKETIAPMLRDVPRLAQIVFEESEDSGPKDSANTIRHKRFPGGVLSLVGANSGAGFRRVSRKVVILDEIDAYPPSAGSDGDPVRLAIKRTEFYWDRKVLMGSTPLVKGRSRIEARFLAGDQRRFYVPCPSCGHADFLVFSERAPTEAEAAAGSLGGHFMAWQDGEPESAYFVCKRNGCVIDHSQKREIVERGEWRGAAPFRGHASFHIWTAYSYSPNATWGQIAEEFLAAKGDREALRVFVNTTLGETWQEAGDAPEWERLYARRESYAIGSVPAGVRFLTAGVDVQKDRWVFEIVGWGDNKESWSIDAGVIMGDTADEAAWTLLDELLDRSYASAQGPMVARLLAVDSGYRTQMTYNWARRHGGRVMAAKGVSKARTIIGAPTPVDVKLNGQRFTRGAKVWPVGVDIAKSELYGWLRLAVPIENAPHPAGFVHFPEHPPEWFQQLTAEHLVMTSKRGGYVSQEWQKIPNRENHWLDARIYARAAAAVLGLDRMTPKAAPAPAAPVVFAPRPVAEPPPPRQVPATKERPVRTGSFLGDRGKGFLKRR